MSVPVGLLYGWLGPRRTPPLGERLGKLQSTVFNGSIGGEVF